MEARVSALASDLPTLPQNPSREAKQDAKGEQQHKPSDPGGTAGGRKTLRRLPIHGAPHVPGQAFDRAGAVSAMR